MVWFVLLHLVGFLVDLLTATRHPEHDKDLQILVLQHQLRLLQRERPQPPRLTRWEKLTLAVLTAKLAHSTAGPRARLDHLLLAALQVVVHGPHDLLLHAHRLVSHGYLRLADRSWTARVPCSRRSSGTRKQRATR